MLTDGLDGVDGEGITHIICAGMGGELIADIISRCGWLDGVNLVLQPMTKPDILRKRLYDLARQGIEVERQPREIEVDSLAVTEYDPDKREGLIEIVCGKGTYIDEMLTVIGAENVTGDIDYAWPAISEEEAVAEDPDDDYIIGADIDLSEEPWTPLPVEPPLTTFTRASSFVILTLTRLRT